MKSKTFIPIQSGGYFGDACIREGFMKSGESAVIEYDQFMKFMNTRSVTRPVFVTPYYGVAVEVARDLNDSANEIELQRHLAEWVNTRA
jgi:hypothetical protein